MTTWVPGASGSLFDVNNLPYGVFNHRHSAPRVGVRIGNFLLDVAPLAATDRIAWDTTYDSSVFDQPSLNPLMRLGSERCREVREWIVGLLTDESRRSLVEPHLLPLNSVELRMPVHIGDYVDFYASLDHASNVGRMFRPDQEPLLPNWRHLPVGYHGRSGTVVHSWTDIIRPIGQRKNPRDPEPVFGPTERLDLEAELGFVVGAGTELGSRVTVDKFASHVFGVVGLNDWSARDIQAWEYVPLGPFLGKSFATTISSWVTPLEALAEARVDVPGQHPSPMPYLKVGSLAGLDIEVDVMINGHVVSRPSYRSMYWSPAQMLAHLTVNGASIRTGDLFASGTISGPEREQRGSLLELTWGWREPFAVGDGERLALRDGDEVVIRYTAPGVGGGRIGLGDVAGVVLPARID